MCINHLFYADGSFVVAPSPSALQMVISIGDEYAKENYVTYHSKKPVCMAMLPKRLEYINVPTAILDSKALKSITGQKYLAVL